jgi:hypothetical protein
MLLRALVGFYARQSEDAGRLAAIGFLFAFVGTVLIKGDFYANTFATPLVDLRHPELLDSPYGGVLQFWCPLDFEFLALARILFGVATRCARICSRGRRGCCWLERSSRCCRGLMCLCEIIFDMAVAWLGIALMKQSALSAPARRHLRRT